MDADWWESTAHGENSVARENPVKPALSRPAHQREAPCKGVTQTVETVEKVPFQKLIFEKWDKNIEKYLVFCVPNNILAIFEPVVGDFCEEFLIKGFFDSLISPHQKMCKEQMVTHRKKRMTS